MEKCQKTVLMSRVDILLWDAALGIRTAVSWYQLQVPAVVMFVAAGALCCFLKSIYGISNMKDAISKHVYCYFTGYEVKACYGLG